MNSNKLSNKGFTLVELIITVAIIGILASIAIPAYTDYVNKARATDATGTLADMRVRMEQYFQDNRTYVGGPTAAPSGANTQFFAFGGNATATTYSLTATGSGAMSGYSYSINQNNVKASVVPGGGNTNCWVTNKDSSSC